MPTIRKIKTVAKSSVKLARTKQAEMKPDNSKTSNEKGIFQFLKESPLTSGDGLSFGHKEIVATLSQIITTQQHNLTIGLFGGWGSGKSSIVESLKTSLKEQKVPLVVFDVWKHEGDALRRTFLNELVEKLDSEFGKEYFKPKYRSSQRLRYSMNSAQEVFAIKWPRFFLHLFVMLCLGVVLLSILAIINWLLSFLGADFFSDLTAEQIGVASGAALSATVLYKYADYFIKAEKTEFKEERFQDPQEFELEFAKIIENLSDKTNKIVVTFDNLDRVSGDNALKVISTIKTFLDYNCKAGDLHKTVYFLIPCDVNSMKKHIAFTDNSSDEQDKLEAKEMYWEEFLRKFFNTSIWIPEFYPTDLERFAVDRLKEVNVGSFNNDQLSWMIIKVFNKNPRQIIQFINILLSNYLMLKQFCESNEFHDTAFYRNNVPQLAKFLLIKQKHASVLDSYLKNCIYDLNDPGMLESINDLHFKVLLKQTDDIAIPSLEPFFTYRLSKDEQENQPIVQYIKAVMNKEKTDELAEKIDFGTASIAFSGIVRQQLRVVRNVLIKTELVEKVLELIISAKLNPDNNLSRELTHFFNSPVDDKIFRIIPPTKVRAGVFDAGAGVTPSQRKTIVDKYLTTLGLPEDTPERLKDVVFNRHFQHMFEFIGCYDHTFDPAQMSLVHGALEKYYEHESVLDYFFTTKAQQDKFITESFIKNVISGFNPLNSLSGAYRIFLLLNSLWPREEYLVVITDLLATNFSLIFLPDNIEKNAEKLRGYGDLINVHLSRRSDVGGGELDPQLESLLTSCIDFLKGLTFSEQLEYFPLVMTLTRFEHSKDGAISIINTILVEGDVAAILFILDEKYQLAHQPYASEFQEQLLAVMIKYDDLFNSADKLPINAIAMLVVKYMENGQFELAKSLIITYRDQWDSGIKQPMLEEMVALFSFTPRPGIVPDNFSQYIQLILFASDNDPGVLAVAGLWYQLGEMLTESTPEDRQRLVLDTIKGNLALILPGEIEMLIHKLMQALLTHRYNNDYVFNEGLVSLFEAQPTSGYLMEYMSFIFQQLISQSVTTNVFVICAKAISEMEYDIQLFLPDINSYLDRATGMSEEQLANAYIVLKAVYERSRGNNHQPFKEVRTRIKQLGQV